MGNKALREYVSLLEIKREIILKKKNSKHGCEGVAALKASAHVCGSWATPVSI